MDQNLDLSGSVNLQGDASSAISSADAATAAWEKLAKTLEDAGVTFQQFGTDAEKAEEALQKIGAGAERTAPQVDRLKESITGARGEIGNAEKEFGAFGGFVADVSEHARLFGTAFSAMGLDTEAAASRVSGLGQILAGLGDAAPGILAVATAAAALFAAFDVGKTAIDVAAQTQQALMLLGNTVKDQGQDWSKLSDEVKKWVETQAASSTFTETQLLASLQRLTITGMSVKDAMTTVRVAEDAAAGSGRDLESVTRMLMLAEQGRTMGLVQLGIVTRQQVHDGMTFNEVLAAVEKHMGGDSAVAANTYLGALSGLHAAWDQLYTDLGSKILPLFTAIIQNISDVVRSIDSELQPAFKDLGEWVKSEIPKIGPFFEELYQGFHKIFDAIKTDIWPQLQAVGKAFGDVVGDVKNLNDELSANHAAFGTEEDDLRNVTKSIGYILGQLAEFIEDLHKVDTESDQVWANMVTAMQPVIAAIQAVDGALQLLYGTFQAVIGAAQWALGGGKGTWDASKGNIIGGASNVATAFGVMSPPTAVGGPSHGFIGPPAPNKPDMADSSSGGWTPAPIDTTIKGGDKELGLAKHGGKGPGQQDFQPMELTSQKDEFKGVEAEAIAASNAVKLFSEQERLMADVVGTATTPLEKIKLGYQEYQQEISGTQNLITRLEQAHKDENAALYTVDTEVTKAASKYDELASQYNKAAAAVDHTNAPTKQQVQHVHELQKEAEGAKKTLDELTATQTKLKSETERTSTELENQQHKLAALQNEVNKISLAWSEFLDKEERDQKNKLTTLGMNQRELYDYYLKLYQQDYQAFIDAQAAKNKDLMNYILPIMESDWKAYNNAAMKIYEDDYNNWRQWVDKATQYFQQFVDAVVIQHKSLRDELKGIFTQIEEYFVSMIAKMIAESILFSTFFKNIFTSGGTSWLGQLFGLGGGVGGGTGPSGQTTGGPLSPLGIAGPNAQASALQGASSYGILGAFLGPSGAASVIATLSTSTSGGERGVGNFIPGGGGSFGGFGGIASGSLANNAASSSASSSLSGLVSSLVGGGSAPNATAALAGTSASSAASSAFPAFTGSNFGSGAVTPGGAGGYSWAGGLSSSDFLNAANTASNTNQNYSSLYNSQMLAQGGAGTPGGGFAPGSAAGTSAMMPTSGGIMGLLGPALMAGGIGKLIGNLAFGGKGESGMGSFLGGIGGFLGILGLQAALTSSSLFAALPAFLAAGPAGIGILLGATILGALLGGELGSLFGDHFPKANEPDIYQTKQWGQVLADLQGSTSGNPMNANGQKFVMDSNTSQTTGGLGWNVMMENFVAMFRNQQKVLPQELQAGFPQLEALWGGAQNHPDFNDNGKNGYLQIGSGKFTLWTDYWNAVTAYGPAIAQLMAQYTPSDLYAASLNGTVTNMGSYTPGGDPWLLHDFPDAGTPLGAGSAAPSVQGPSGMSKRTVTTVNVINQFGGSLIAQKAMEKYIVESLAATAGYQIVDMNTTTGG